MTCGSRNHLVLLMVHTSWKIPPRSKFKWDWGPVRVCKKIIYLWKNSFLYILEPGLNSEDCKPKVSKLSSAAWLAPNPLYGFAAPVGIRLVAIPAIYCMHFLVSVVTYTSYSVDAHYYQELRSEIPKLRSGGAEQAIIEMRSRKWVLFLLKFWT